MNLEELVNLSRNISEENPLPSDYADQLNAAIVAELEPRDATIEQLTNEKGELDGRLKEYAVKNYELMKNQPLPNSGSHVESNGNETPKPIGVDELLKKAGY